MKRFFFTILAALYVMSVAADSIRIMSIEHMDGSEYKIPVQDIQRITFYLSGGSIPDVPEQGDTVVPVEPEIVAIPENVNIPARALTVSQARDICAVLDHQATTGTQYYVHGWVKKMHSKHVEWVNGYGNGTFYLSEHQYDDGSYDIDDFMAYQVYYLNGEKFTSADQVQEGDYVVIYGELTNYNGTYETVGKGQAYIYSTSREDGNSGVIGDIDYLAGEISCTNLVNSSVYQNLAVGDTTIEKYTVRGIVKEIKEVNTGAYGNATFYITDGTNDVYCYHVFAGADKEKFVSSKQLIVGDTVTVKAILSNHNGTKELKDGYIVRTSNTFDTSGIDTSTKLVTVAEVLAMNLANGEITEGTYQITGTVSDITDFNTQYGNATFTIMDNSTTEELRIYRAYYLGGHSWTEGDPQIQVGDRVTLLGSIRNYNGTNEFVSCYISEHN